MARDKKDEVVVLGRTTVETKEGTVLNTTGFNAEKPEIADVEVIVENPEKNPTVQKMFKITPKKNHTCCIGGTWYYLKKGESINVPDYVKDVLKEADLLSPN